MRNITWILLICLCSNSLRGQQKLIGTPEPTSKSSSNFYNIIINDQPNQNQRNVTICSAINGWLFAAYTYLFHDSVEWVSIFKSIDNGHTWQIISNASTDTPSYRFKKFQMICQGIDTNNLKLMFSMCFLVTGANYNIASVNKFNVNTQTWEPEILLDYSRELYDLSIAGDDIFPATGSNPGSIAAIYFKRYQHDSIYFCASANGGQSFTTRRNIAGTNKHFGKVALAYGRSQSFPSGRYFAAWEEKESDTSQYGHIYTAHTEPNFDSPFTTPICIDIIDSSTNNKVRRPAIACQASAYDNDSSDLSLVTTFEHYLESMQQIDVSGYFNKRGATGNHFQFFSPGTNSHQKLNPDIAFNPYDSTFMLTCFDSTDLKLPYQIQPFNLINPGNWTYLSQGYNNDPNISQPKPSIRLDHSLKSGMNCWIAERSNGNGMAMFTSSLLFPVGIQNDESGRKTLTMNIYPNPATTNLFLDLMMDQPTDVTVSLYNECGVKAKNDEIIHCQRGKNIININVSNFPIGLYLIGINEGGHFTTSKIIVQ